MTSAPTLMTPLPTLRRDRALHAWVAATAVSFAGDSVLLVAFAWAAVHEAPPVLAGLLVGVGMIPQALFLLLGGAIADRWNSRRIMLSCNAVRAVVLVLGAGAWFAGLERVPLMFAVALTFGVADALYKPASSTLPRQMVRPEDLGPVSGMFQVGQRLATFVGAALGGWLSAAYGLGVAMLVDGATFVVVGVVLWALVRPRFPRPRSISQPLLAGVRDGIGHLRRRRLARDFVVAITGLNLFLGPATTIGVALQASRLGWGAGAVGATEAALGAGAALGAVAAIRWRPDRDALAGFVVLVVQGGAIAALGLTSFPAVVAAAAVIGSTSGVASVYISGAFQRSLDPAYLGRVSSMATLGDYALMPAMMPAFGWLANATSVSWTCLAFGVGMAALSLWGASRRSLRAVRLGKPRSERAGQSSTSASRWMTSRS